MREIVIYYIYVIAKQVEMFAISCTLEIYRINFHLSSH
jgi:hypothetical protein